MTSGARQQSVRSGCAVIAAATVAAAAATNATVYKGEEGRKFTTAERQALGCQCVASCYHFREYSPWPYRFSEKKRASGEEGIKVVSWNVNTLRRVVSTSFLESTEVWDVAMFQDTKHWSHDHLRWMGDSIMPFTNSNRNQPTFRHMPPHSFGLVTLVRSTTKAVMKESGPRYLVVEITCPGGRVALVNLYAPLWLRHTTPRQLDRMRVAARKAGEGDVAYSDRCSKETAMVAEFDDFVENLTAIQARAESQRMPILYAGDYNSDLCAGMPWWMTKVLQNGWGNMMEPAAESIQHTYRSPQTVGMDGDGGTSRIDGFCVPEAIAPLLRYPEMQIAEPTDNAYYDHVPIRCELLMGNIQPIRQMRDQFRYPTKYIDKDAISPQLYEAITRALVSVLASKESTNEDMLTRIGELAQLIERPACEQRRRRDPPDRDKKHLRQLLSQAIRAGAREIVPLVRKLIQQHDKKRAAERLANLKKRNIDKLATAPAEIYAMVRGEYKENPTVSALQHPSGHMVTGKASVEEILMHKWRTEVFDLPPSAATPEFRETFLQPPSKQAQNTARLMADVTVDEVRDVAQALNSKAAVIGLPLHFFTQDRDDVREAIARRCTRMLREGVESLPRFELVMLLKEAGVCTDPLKLRPIALSTAVYRFFRKDP